MEVWPFTLYLVSSWQHVITPVGYTDFQVQMFIQMIGYHVTVANIYGNAQILLIYEIWYYKVKFIF